MFWIAQLLLLTLLPLLILRQLLPALFQVAVWLTRTLFALLFSLTGWRPAQGPLILLGGALWAGVTLLWWPWVGWLLPAATTFWLLAGVGGLWGLCVGHQAGLLWQAELLRLPDADPQRLFELPSHFFRREPGSPRGAPPAHDLDELLRQGIILGQRGDEEEEP